VDFSANEHSGESLSYKGKMEKKAIELRKSPEQGVTNEKIYHYKEKGGVKLKKSENVKQI